MEIVVQLHLWLVQRSVLVKGKVGSLKRDLTLNFIRYHRVSRLYK